MRVADRPTAVSASPNVVGDTSGLALRLALACLSVLVLLMLWSPAVVWAQAAAKPATQPPASIVIEKRPGESLHDIAVRLFNDSTRWRAIASANGLATTDSKLVVGTGTRLRIPVRTTPSSSAARPAAPTGSLAAQTAGKRNADSASAAAARKTPPRSSTARSTTAANRPRPAGGTAAQGAKTAAAVPVRDSSARAANVTAAARAAVDERPIERSGQRIGLVNASDMRAARGKDEPTVFLGRVGQSEAEIRRSVEATQASRNVIAPRHGEYAAAPFPIQASRLAIAGRVIRRLNGNAAVDPDLPRNVSVAEEAVVSLPSGVSASIGQRFVAFQRGPVLSSGVYVALPTGVLEVVRADAGQPIVARVMRQSGIIEEGQSIVAFEGSPAPANVRPTVVANDAVTGSVRFIMGDQLLPSLQSFVVLDANESQGVQQGDEFWMVERFGTGADARERRIAVVRIVRTSPHGSTGIVTHQDRPGIVVGAAVRRVARAGTGAGD